MKRSPPYARLLVERAARTTNTMWVLIGADAWQTASRWAEPNNGHRPFTLCPPDQDPAIYEWSMYRDAPAPLGLVQCGEAQGDQLRQLVMVLLEAGAPRVLDLFEDVIYAGAAA